MSRLIRYGNHADILGEEGKRLQTAQLFVHETGYGKQHHRGAGPTASTQLSNGRPMVVLETVGANQAIQFPSLNFTPKPK